MRLSKPLPVVLLASAIVTVAVWPAEAQQRARPRSAPAVGQAAPRSSGARPPARPGYGSPARPGPYYGGYYRGYRGPYYRSYYWPSYWSSYWPSSFWPYYWPYYGFGFSLGFGRPYGYPGAHYGGFYPGYYGEPGQALGGIRFLVMPKNAEVYVGGYLAGIVDSFDGTFQKLSLPSGEQDIVLYCEGYRSVHQTVYVPPGQTLKLSYQMEPLAPGEIAEARPTPPAPEAVEPPATAPAEPYARPGSYAPPAGVDVQPGSFGTLSVRVQPADAEILVDGEPWQGSGGNDRLVLHLAAGPHRVVVRKAGYETFSGDVDVRAGETTPLNVSILERQ